MEGLSPPTSPGFTHLPAHPATLAFSLAIGLSEAVGPLAKSRLGTSKEGILGSGIGVHLHREGEEVRVFLIHTRAPSPGTVNTHRLPSPAPNIFQ